MPAVKMTKLVWPHYVDTSTSAITPTAYGFDLEYDEKNKQWFASIPTSMVKAMTERPKGFVKK